MADELTTVDLDRLLSDAPGYEPEPRHLRINDHLFTVPPRTRYARHGIRDGRVVVEYQDASGSWVAATEGRGTVLDA